MKKLLLLIAVCGLITLSKAAQPDEVRHRKPPAASQLSAKPKAAKCTWKPNREASKFTDPTKQIAGFLSFFDGSGEQIISVDYNPITKEVRYLKEPNTLHGKKENVKKRFPRGTFKAIAQELGLDVTEMDETECNESIAAWLPQPEPFCSIQ